MLKWLRRLGVFLVVLICAVTVAVVWILYYQGRNNISWDKLKDGHVSFDAQGIPTVEAADWITLVRHQGYVHAADRMWQMDLIRRSSSGRLSELFGAKALEHDKSRVLEDWQGTANRSYDKLPSNEKAACDAYATGVNQFISDNKDHWGIEYQLIRAVPEPWHCSDSLLVMLYMSDVLTSSAKLDFRQAAWREKLSDEWQNFLFPKTHPWAKPLFGKASTRSASFPPSWQYLPKSDLKHDGEKESGFSDPVLKGSNAWAVRDGGSLLLAGDPHLGQSVPQTWYANRLRINRDTWVVGVSLPGLPGVVIGMNQTFAWSLTNLGEDVDDYLRETITPDGQQYLAFEESGRQNFRRLVRKRAIIKVKGQDDVVIEARFTHRGPLTEQKVHGETQFFSRQWIALQSGFLRLPTLAVNQARSWLEFNKAFDAMLAPCQAVVYADRDGNIGFRVTGVGVKRQVSGLIPQPAEKGEWLEFEPLSERKRVFFPNQARGANRVMIASANAQIWEDPYGHRWMSDDRRERIERALSEAKVLDRQTMEALQLDTESRFAKEFLRWIADNDDKADGGLQNLFKRWRHWDGTSIGDEQSFTEAEFLEKELASVLIRRVREHFFRGIDDLPDYESFLRRAWMTRLIETPNSARVFGLEDKDLAHYLVNRLKQKLMQGGSDALVKYSVANAWGAQHPFVENVPYIGWLFKVQSFPQFGGMYLVRAERPRFGPSMRLVWNLKNPKDSSWAFPVGQSGHIGSAYYRDQQRFWAKGEKRSNPFPDQMDWGFK